jgi:hypothetical protein
VTGRSRCTNFPALHAPIVPLFNAAVAVLRTNGTQKERSCG